jgi:predicted ATPase
VAKGEVQAFGTLLRQHRLAAGLSQEALAEKAGLSVRGLSDLERGVRRAPYPATVARLAEALGLDAAARMALATTGRRAETPVDSDDGADRPEPALPTPLSSFVGRERELAEIGRLLKTTRLLTLTGAGGVGKTRLALEAARTSAAEPTWAPVFVELAPLVDGASVPQAVAAALAVPERAGRPLLDTLADAIGPRAVLLVLDNCEHLVAACAELADHLLRACARLRLLATSREPLGVVGEAVWRVPSLALPNQGQPAPVEQVARCEAISLFIERARLVLPGFELTDRNAPAVVQICRRLDGVALAIELAAARMAVLSAEQIAARLDDRFALLSGGGRTAPLRQRTLRETVEWSYGLLSPAERSLFDRLSVFAGGCTLEAVEAVMGTEDAESGPADVAAPSPTPDGQIRVSVLDLLSGLVSKSLVLAEPAPDGPVRYRLLETLRQYGRERLDASGEAETTRRRHAEYYLRLAEAAEPELRGPRQDVWLAQLEQEHDNFRAALAWSRTSGSAADLGVRLAGALGWFWYVHGHPSEGRRQIDAALEAAGDVSAAARARALGAAGFLARIQGEPAVSWALLEESVDLHRALGDSWGVAFGLNGLGMVARRRGDYERAAVLCEEGLVLFQDVGDRWGVAWSLVHVGEVAAERGDQERAVEVLEQALAVARELGNGQISAWALANLARLAEVRGDNDQAVAIVGESLGLFRELGDPRGTALLLGILASVAQARGDHERARAWYAESLHLRREIRDSGGIAECLEGLAAAMVHRQASAGGTVGEPPEQEVGARDAVRLFGAAEALREAVGAPVPLFCRAAYDRAVAAARAELADAAFAAAWAHGRRLPVDQAIEEALARDEPASSAKLWP